MSATATARRELAEFLRSRRRQVDPRVAGVPAGGVRRTPGLRREEVALLSGVSHTWYTWLEQGRDIRPSRQVVDALARTLRMSPAEHG
ncbi:MAG TPA: helix-turn-helix transcriptional regulator, partial [Geodermatophilus sp.]|nr:helix-turn-helix transcriptional regulator [Geodermatophilus sp.]